METFKFNTVIAGFTVLVVLALDLKKIMFLKFCFFLTTDGH
jgi:hypothetical protein